ncbi:DNA-binding protein [Testicularia cyperi]|uniref:DNA-binding protein n=1 Tax=Testicularia cyperi TaxID=1882483 RepID=A0A317XRK1_9BASI|nr:DNA-binding protein [Testicularia cyperi]
MDKGKARELDAGALLSGAPDRLEDSPLSYNQLVSGIVDFLEVAFHTILCLRSVYPFEVFSRRKKYGHACYQSRHPGLNEYLSRVLAATRREIEASKVSKVIVVIRPNEPASLQPRNSSGSSSGSHATETPLGPSHGSHAYERFVFSLDYILPAVLIDPRNRDLAISGNLTSKELELVCRNFLQKLMVCDGMLYDMPTATSEEAELTFAVVLEMIDDETPAGRSRDEPDTGEWVPADSENMGRMLSAPQGRSRDAFKAASRLKIRPIKTLDSGVINLMLYIEEDVYAKSGFTDTHVATSGSAVGRSRSKTKIKTQNHLEETLLLSKATQLESGASNAREMKNKARRLDAERDLDQPAIAEAEAAPDILQAKRKNKARMVLGETRAAESDSASDTSDDIDSSQSIRDGGGAGSDMDM